MQVLLIGNPNTGKTTLYNTLTKSSEHVGNWHGVTVEEKEKNYNYQGKKIDLVDLPGLYSLTTLSYEEEVARNCFLMNKNKKIINICDASNIERNLYLTLNLLEARSDVVLAINYMDKNCKNRINLNALSKHLGISVVAVNPGRYQGIDDLNAEVLKEQKKRKQLPYLKKIDLTKIKQLISPFFDKNMLEFFAIKCFEKDEYVISKLPENKWKEIEIILPKNSEEIIAKLRYEYIDFLMNKCVISTNKIYGKSKIDKVLLNKFFALPIFLLILAGIFYLTFFSVGKVISNALLWVVDVCISGPLRLWLGSVFGESSWVVSLFSDAIVGGVGTIFSFLPQVALLFMFLSILEDSGYLSRIAFLFEDIFSKVGLSGKSIYTLLMGFGCSSTAVLTARNMEDKNAKIKTALLTPYMSCSAKFPLYVVIGGAFFGVNNIFYIMGLYILGVVVSILLSLILEKTVLKSKEQSFILEFPPYRKPSPKRVLKVLWENVLLFITRVGSLLISMNIIVWILSNFSFSFKYVPSSQGSILESIGRIIAPIFIPLGFGSWGASSALVAGIIAKEVILTSIVMFNSIGKGQSTVEDSFRQPESAVFFPSTAHAMSFLVFSLLYTPCVTTMAVLSKEIGKKWTIIGVLIQFVIGYLSALFVFNLFGCFNKFGLIPVILILLAFLTIMGAMIVVIDKSKKKRLCSKACINCAGCDKT